MKLLKRSLLLGFGFEGLLLLIAYLGLALGRAGHGCVPDSWFMALLATTFYPATFLAGLNLQFPLNLAAAFAFAGMVWTGVVYLLLRGFTKKG